MTVEGAESGRRGEKEERGLGEKQKLGRGGKTHLAIRRRDLRKDGQEGPNQVQEPNCRRIVVSSYIHT